jgi:hypothetical protein
MGRRRIFLGLMAEGAVVNRLTIQFLSKEFLCEDKNEHSGDD